MTRLRASAVCVMVKKTRAPAMLFMAAMITGQIYTWSKADDIPVESLPAAVKEVVESYARILKESKSVDEAAAAFAAIAGGSLVNENGTVSNNTKQFGLKKDFNNFKHYAYPINIALSGHNFP